MDVLSLLVAAITIAVSLQAALILAVVACMLFAVVPATVGWLAGRLAAPFLRLAANHQEAQQTPPTR